MSAPTRNITAKSSKDRSQTEPAAVRWLLIAIALVFLALFLLGQRYFVQSIANTGIK